MLQLSTRTSTTREWITTTANPALHIHNSRQIMKSLEQIKRYILLHFDRAQSSTHQAPRLATSRAPALLQIARCCLSYFSYCPRPFVAQACLIPKTRRSVPQLRHWSWIETNISWSHRQHRVGHLADERELGKPTTIIQAGISLISLP